MDRFIPQDYEADDTYDRANGVHHATPWWAWAVLAVLVSGAMWLVLR